MDGLNKGIPTDYKGAAMRSLLEAKWAAFFDCLGWKWVYEPCEFNGWIPDFVLIGEKQQTFVEVKPVFEFPTEVAEKIDAAGVPGEVLIVGMAPLVAKCESMGLKGALGWLRESWPGNEGTQSEWWDVAHFHSGGSRIGFHHATGSYHDRITGFYDGDHGSFYEDESRIMDLWHRASSRVQWKPRG